MASVRWSSTDASAVTCRRSKNWWRRSKNSCQRQSRRGTPSALTQDTPPRRSLKIEGRHTMETTTMANHDVHEESKPAYEVVHSKSEVFYPEFERKSHLTHHTHYFR